MIIRIDIPGREYDVTVERDCLKRASELLNLNRKCLVVTDDGVPSEYVEALADQCREAVVVDLPQGESSKNLDNLETLLTAMLEAGFTRGDCVVAVGGGMAGDIAGFAAATYMRGIDFSATAFFMIVVISQWSLHRSKIPFIAAAVCSALCFILLGAEHFLIPAIITSLTVLLVFRKQIEEKEAE